MKQRIGILLLSVLFINMAFGQDLKAPETLLNKELIAVLDTIYREDQKYREESQELQKKYEWNSKEVQELWKIIEVKDSINLIKIEKIIVENGWLGADIIGERGSSTLFLVIQHSMDINIQKKYLPVLRDAVEKGNAKAKDLALFEDRTALLEGKKQIYGSQLETDYKTKKYVVYPMIDPDNVDKRRAEVGLKPLAEYLQFWDLPWDVEQFKKRMEEYDLQKNKK